MSETYIIQAFRELCLDVPKNVTNETLGGYLVPDIKGRCIRKGEGDGLMVRIVQGVQSNVERDCTDVRGMASTSLDKLGDGRKLVLRGGQGNIAGVKEEAEKCSFSGCLSSDHEGVSAGRSVNPSSDSAVPRSEKSLSGWCRIGRELVILGG
jgi:hypothetical protein